MFIALHLSDLGKECGAFLKTLGYNIVTSDLAPVVDANQDMLEIIALPDHTES
jgi:hypothetical protein